ncbi:hypothetical protein ALC56_05828 [Trachymyrmex septentrionalis]|uniref:Uncharacterized protein n=1 Tax=Trachymyrmex septentrionalis TaxID=34720 RepID=A0A151JXC7_9HYME|nr:hypothetical protein ALC56_05828 [Trachymyrmex septentrionalis]
MHSHAPIRARNVQQGRSSFSHDAVLIAITSVDIITSTTCEDQCAMKSIPPRTVIVNEALSRHIRRCALWGRAEPTIYRGRGAGRRVFGYIKTSSDVQRTRSFEFSRASELDHVVPRDVREREKVKKERWSAPIIESTALR